MSPVADLFAERSRLSRIAEEMRCPVGTVFSWKKSGSIPPWRRPAVLEAVRRLKYELPADVLAYLASGE
jgi:hypothetical protein